MKRIITGILVLVVLLTCFSASGEAKLRKICEIDSKLNAVRYTYVDENGNPTEGPDGYVTAELVYEGRKKWPEKIRFLNAEGERVANKDGYAVVKYAFSSKRLVTKIALYDAEGALYEMEDGGFSRVSVKYDDQMKLVDAIYYDNDKEQVEVEDELQAIIGKLITAKGRTTVSGLSEEEMMEAPKNRTTPTPKPTKATRRPLTSEKSRRYRAQRANCWPSPRDLPVH